MRLTPVMFEAGARPHPPQELYRAYLAQSDVFIGLYWQRYGQVGPGMAVSGLEEEFQLPEVRLVTLTGPGGVGKTRLAVAVGKRVADRFGVGTVFVPLASVAQLEQVVAGIARAVGAELAGTSSPLEALVEQLGDDPWLLILDNLEQVVDATSGCVTTRRCCMVQLDHSASRPRE